MSSQINYKASIGVVMKEYLTPDTIPAWRKTHVMATKKAHHIRARNVLPPNFGKIAMALHERRVNHQIIDVRKKAEHLFKHKLVI